jgi:hypothetical protein
VKEERAASEGGGACASVTFYRCTFHKPLGSGLSRERTGSRIKHLENGAAGTKQGALHGAYARRDDDRTNRSEAHRATGRRKWKDAAGQNDFAAAEVML